MVPKGDLLAADGSWWERRVVPWPKQNPTGVTTLECNAIACSHRLGASLLLLFCRRIGAVACPGQHAQALCTSE